MSVRFGNRPSRSSSGGGLTQARHFSKSVNSIECRSSRSTACAVCSSKWSSGLNPSRAFALGGIVGVAIYALGLPKESFTDKGEIRPFKALSPHPSATNVHFLAAPVGAAIAAYQFT